MRVRLLGTGSADGWPNAFCGCAACLEAHRTGRLRGPTSALVDGRLLLDCGPETPRAALRHDVGLRQLTHIFITHDHPDHSAPMALLARAWAGRTEPITVVGPAAVIASWCQWTGPQDPVRWKAVLPGDLVNAGTHRVRVLAAAHGDVPAVVYDVTGPDGERLLYATDTGPLPAETVAATGDAEYDLVLLEATFGDRAGPGRPAGSDHLDLSTFADQMVRLRETRALTRVSRVAAVHLSHHSPRDLRPRLAAWGVQLVDDGHEFVLDRTAGRAGRPTTDATDATGLVDGLPDGLVDLPGGRPDQAPMPRRTLIVGGARSGKSTVAERLLAAEPAVTYVATGTVPDGSDPDWAERVGEHRRRRPRHWQTRETADLSVIIRHATGPVLVDCLGTWLTSVLDRVGAWEDASGWQQALDREVDDLVEAWHAAPQPVVAVSNEVGSGVVPPTVSGRVFRDQLGRLNARVSAASERVLLVVAGRTLDLAAGPASVVPSTDQAGDLADGPADGPAEGATAGPLRPRPAGRPASAHPVGAPAVNGSDRVSPRPEPEPHPLDLPPVPLPTPWPPMLDLTVHDRAGPWPQDPS